MTRVLQVRRGNTAQNNDFTGLVGEITMDTDAKTLRVHDGETIGGIALARASDIMGDYVVETQFPTTENNYTWYRKYKSGWVEQGGYSDTTTDTIEIFLIIPFSNTNYHINITQGLFNSNASDIRNRYIRTKETNKFITSSISGIGFYWSACGQSL